MTIAGINETQGAGLYSVGEAASRLGGISVWTLRAHINRKNVAVVRIGRRVLVSSEEIERIRREGLPSLVNAAKSSTDIEVTRSNTEEVNPR